MKDSRYTMALTSHQIRQQEVIQKIADQLRSNTLHFSTVSPIQDFQNDPRICLTSVHLPHAQLLDRVRHTIIEPLRQVEPDFYYYADDSLHMTIKNIRVINDPPHFSQRDIEKAKAVFSQVIPKHNQFTVYFSQLLLFPNNLALVGTTDPELDEIILDLNTHLQVAGVPDDKVYVNSQYFFSNMTLCRFSAAPSEKFKQTVSALSDSVPFEPYVVDSVTLLSGNAALKNKHIHGTWQLK